MIYKLVDKTRYLQGLPVMAELDDDTLDAATRRLLTQAVAIGIYAPAGLPATEPPAAPIPLKQSVDFSKSKKGQADDKSGTQN